MSEPQSKATLRLLYAIAETENDYLDKDSVRKVLTGEGLDLLDAKLHLRQLERDGVIASIEDGDYFTLNDAGWELIEADAGANRPS